MMGGLGLNQLGPHNQGPQTNQLDTNSDSKTSIDLKLYFFPFEAGKYQEDVKYYLVKPLSP